MVDTKLTRPEACAELAHRIWPEAVTVRFLFAKSDVQVRPNEDAPWRDWNPFVNRDAAAEVVGWVATNPADIVANFEFALRVRLVDSQGSGLMRSFPATAGLLATPEQIALAACDALNIETE